MSSYPPRDRCWECNARSGLLTIYHVSPRPTDAVHWPEGARWSQHHRTVCCGAAACRARIVKRKARARQRSSVLFVLVEPRCPDAPGGTCKWCGEAIYSSDGKGVDRRRRYHYGPLNRHELRGRPPMLDEPDCVYWYHHWRTMDSRVALQREAEALGRTVLRCADCGRECSRQRPLRQSGQAGWWWDSRPWEADHELALEDGGEHRLENLAVRCAPCHRAKTAEENRARAAERRRLRAS